MSIVAYEKFLHHNIPVRKKEQDICIAAVDIAKALDYQKPKEAVVNIINRNKQEFEGLIHSPNLGVSYKDADTIFLDEEGIYLFSMLAKTPRARQFRRWVIGIIKKHRESKMIVDPTNPMELAEILNKQMALLIQDGQDTKQRLVAVEEATRVHSVDRHQASDMKKKIDYLVGLMYESTGQPKGKLYKKVYGGLYEKFNVASYRDIPRALLSDVFEWLDDIIVEYGGYTQTTMNGYQ